MWQSQATRTWFRNQWDTWTGPRGISLPQNKVGRDSETQQEALLPLRGQGADPMLVWRMVYILMTMYGTISTATRNPKGVLFICTILYFLFFFFGDGVSLLLPRLECNGAIFVVSNSQTQVILPSQPPKVLGLQAWTTALGPKPRILSVLFPAISV